ncbi:MAG: hypothetical protein ACOVLH_01960 [Roseateles sp.]
MLLGMALWQAQKPAARLQPREHSEPLPSLQRRALTVAGTPALQMPAPAPAPSQRAWPTPTALPRPAQALAALTPLPPLPDAWLTPEPFYLPRDLLSVGPAPQETVLLAWPAQSPLRGSFRGVLRLFIDDEGQVRRVEAADAELPEPLFEAARQAFMAVRFSPGELDGRAVRSLIRVEVSFESESLPLAHE